MAENNNKEKAIKDKSRDEIQTYKEWREWIFSRGWINDPVTQKDLFAIRSFLPPIKIYFWNPVKYLTDAKEAQRSIFFAISFGLFLFGSSLFLIFWKYGSDFHIFKELPWNVLALLIPGPAFVLLWWWRHEHKQTDIEQAKENHRLDCNRLDTDTFNTAVKNLGDNSENIRLGGIYTLERLAKNNEDFYPQCIELLCAFFRLRDENEKHKLLCKKINFFDEYKEAYDKLNDLDEKVTFLKERGFAEEISDSRDIKYKVPTDMDAVLTVLKKLSNQYKHSQNYMPINLSKTCLYFVDFSDCYLYGASFVNCNLVDSYFNNSYLSCASFINSNLTRAYFHDAYLNDVHFNCADLKNADFSFSYIGNARFFECKFENTDIEYSNFGSAKNLTQEMIDSAIGNSETLIPEGLVMPEHWKNKH